MENNTIKMLDDMIAKELELLNKDTSILEVRQESINYIKELIDIKVKMIEEKTCLQKQKRVLDYAELGIEVCGIIVPIMFYSRWMNRGLEWEKTGTFTSTTFKGLFSRFSPTK